MQEAEEEAAAGPAIPEAEQLKFVGYDYRTRATDRESGRNERIVRPTTPEPVPDADDVTVTATAPQKEARSTKSGASATEPGRDELDSVDGGSKGTSSSRPNADGGSGVGSGGAGGGIGGGGSSGGIVAASTGISGGGCSVGAGGGGGAGGGSGSSAVAGTAVLSSRPDKDSTGGAPRVRSVHASADTSDEPSSVAGSPPVAVDRTSKVMRAPPVLPAPLASAPMGSAPLVGHSEFLPGGSDPLASRDPVYKVSSPISGMGASPSRIGAAASQRRTPQRRDADYPQLPGAFADADGPRGSTRAEPSGDASPLPAALLVPSAQGGVPQALGSNGGRQRGDDDGLPLPMSYINLSQFAPAAGLTVRTPY